MVTMGQGFQIGDYGGESALIVKEWSRECELQLKARQRLLVLNQARGWNPTSISFLADLEIEQLAILAHTPVDGLEVVTRIRNLRRLSLACESTRAVSLGELPNLETCWVAWSEHYGSILEHRTLRALGVTDFPHKDLRGMQGLRSLQELRLKSGRLTSLHGIATLLENLTLLELGGLRRLEDLSELAEARKLKRLSLDGCKRIRSVDALQTLTSLVSLDLSDMGPLESLAPIRALKSLEEVLMMESTCIVDGDLSPLASLPHLKTTAFRERSHYSHMAFLGLIRPVRKFWKRST